MQTQTSSALSIPTPEDRQTRLAAIKANVLETLERAFEQIETNPNAAKLTLSDAYDGMVALHSFAEELELIVQSVQAASDAANQTADELAEELEAVYAEADERIADVADALSQDEVERILNDPAERDRVTLDMLVSDIKERGFDTVYDEQIEETKRTLRRANDKAQFERGYVDEPWNAD